MAADHKAARKADHHKDREKTQATKPTRQSDLIAAIRDLNIAWPPAAIEMAAAGFTDPQKAELRHHLPDVLKKLQWLAGSIDPESAIAVVDEATCADQPSLFGSNS